MISRLIRSAIKGHRLSVFQRKYSQLESMFIDPKQAITRDQRETLLEKYLDFCLSDENIRDVVNKYKLSKRDLVEITIKLQVGGLGQFIRGHYAALSTMAYPEPLEFTIVKLRRGENIFNICGRLMEYWDEKIPIGALFAEIQRSLKAPY